MPLKDVSLFLGHSSVATTEIYAKTSKEQAAESIDAVNRKLMKDVFFSKESKDDLMAWFDSEIRGPRR